MIYLLSLFFYKKYLCRKCKKFSILHPPFLFVCSCRMFIHDIALALMKTLKLTKTWNTNQSKTKYIFIIWYCIIIYKQKKQNTQNHTSHTKPYTKTSNKNENISKSKAKTNNFKFCTTKNTNAKHEYKFYT